MMRIMAEEIKASKRIQTSFLNAAEHKALVWLAARQPKWVTSNTLTWIGIAGSVIIAAGYILSNLDISWLWLASFGFLVNWYGDSLDGNLARYRRKQRPIYGYYLDHTMDVINEAMMFFGAGMAPFFDMRLTVAAFVLYLVLTLNVSMNAHLRSEFKLTYLKLGPTEFRVIACLLIMCVIFFPCIREFHTSMHFLGREVALTALDIAGLVILAVLVLIYLVTVIQDARGYAKADPMPERRDD